MTQLLIFIGLTVFIIFAGPILAGLISVGWAIYVAIYDRWNARR